MRRRRPLVALAVAACAVVAPLACFDWSVAPEGAPREDAGEDVADGGPKDAGNDARLDGPTDAIADADAPPVPFPCTVDAGGPSCSVGQVCCGTGDVWKCVPSRADCKEQVAAECTSTSQCASGVCCWTQVGPSNGWSTCGACGSIFVLCTSAAECQKADAGTTCDYSPIENSPPFKVCKP